MKHQNTETCVATDSLNATRISWFAHGLLLLAILAVSALFSPLQARNAMPDYVTLVEEQRRTVVKVNAR
ncbi:MAG: hypothetical protein AAF499_04635, partial [Pseudomonadota bacterium]